MGSYHTPVTVLNHMMTKFVMK